MLSSYFTVTSLNNYVKMVLEKDPNFSYLTLRGEISSFKKQEATGHCYLTLKDENSVINAVMFAGNSSSLTFEPKAGDDVLLTGKLSSYPQRGTYQVYIYEMSLFGKGQQLLELEMLKKKLAAEGLFDPSRKRPINKFPKKIGIITASNSAALSDLITNISRRYPLTEIIVFPSLVQGEGAEKDLIKAYKLSQESNLDTLIISRGGGSSEDLSAFNSEELCRLCANSKCPIISAIGHEIDTTLIDFVADVRASTPTGAAELATSDIFEIQNHLLSTEDFLDSKILDKINELKLKVAAYKNLEIFKNPKSLYEKPLNKINEYKIIFDSFIENQVKLYKQEVSLKKQRLISLNPNSILNRGYSIIKGANNKVLSSINDVNVNENIDVFLKDGKLKAAVLSKGE